MRKNIVVFTSGGGGSSLLSGIIARNGYWLGEETRKLNFETYENSELVILNMEILNATNFHLNDCMEIPAPSIARIRNLLTKIETDKYRKFAKKSEDNRPWLWKDPRLCYTIHFWSHFIDVSTCKFIYTTREISQEYVSLVWKRRNFISINELHKINLNYENSIKKFLTRYGVDCFFCTFERLLNNPNSMIDELNEFLEVDIKINDFYAVFKGKKSGNKYNWKQYAAARLLYLLKRYLMHDYIKFPRQNY